MTRIVIALFFMLSVLVGSAGAAKQPGWTDEAGQLLPNTEFRKSIDGFGGWLFITDEAQWRHEWHKQTGEIPRFTESRRLGLGEKLTILTFFTNPRVDDNGNIDVRCDVRLSRPDGTISLDQENIVCAQGRLQGDPDHVFLTQMSIEFVAELTDPSGMWTIDLLLQDRLGSIAIALSSSFELVDRSILTYQPLPVTHY